MEITKLYLLAVWDYMVKPALIFIVAIYGIGFLVQLVAWFKGVELK